MAAALILKPAHAQQADEGSLSPVEFYRLLQKSGGNEANLSTEESAQNYKRLVKANPADGRLWAELGNCQYDLKHYAEAADCFQQAMALGYGNKAASAWFVGRCFAQLGDKNTAFLWLDRALSWRFYPRNVFAQDAELENLRSDPRFKKLCGTPPKTGAPRIERWRYDIDFLLAEIKRMHYRWSRESLPSPLISRARQLKIDVPRLSDQAIAINMQRLLAMLGDGHSRIVPMSEKVPFSMLPLQFFRFEEGTFIVRGHNKGARVLSIGGRSIEALWNKLPAYVSRDNDQGIFWAGPQYLALTGVLEDMGAKVSDQGVSVVFADEEGKPREETYQPVPVTNEFVAHYKLEPSGDPASAPIYLRRVAEYYWTQELPEAKALYIQLNQVNGKKGETLPEFGRRILTDLKAHWRENLILDLRHNSGGYPTLAEELERSLLWYTVEGGRLFVITGRNTFSAAQSLLNNLVKTAKPIIVGEPSSSSPIFIGNVAEAILPYSRLKACISATMSTADPKDTRVWVPADIPVPVRAADYFANRDAALDAILEVISGR